MCLTFFVEKRQRIPSNWHSRSSFCNGYTKSSSTTSPSWTTPPGNTINNKLSLSQYYRIYVLGQLHRRLPRHTLASSDRDTWQFKLGLDRESQVMTGHLAHFSHTGNFCSERSGTWIRQTWQVRSEMHWQGCVHEVCTAALNPSRSSRDITHQSLHSHTGSFGSGARRWVSVGIRSRAVRKWGDGCWKEEISLEMEPWGQACLKSGGYESGWSCIKTSREKGRMVQAL